MNRLNLFLFSSFLFGFATPRAEGPRAAGADASPAPISAREFAGRRARVLAGLANDPGGGVLMLRASPAAHFTEEVEFPYRPANDFLYLTGIDSEGAALLLSAREIVGIGREALFLPPSRQGEGLWIARRPGPEEAAARSGIPAKSVLTRQRLDEILRRVIRSADGSRGPTTAAPPVLHMSLGRHSGPGQPLSDGYGFLVAQFGSSAFHLDLRPAHSLIAPLRQVKSPAEMEFLRRAIAITGGAHRRAMRQARAGVFEYQLAAAIEHEFRDRGAAGWAFPSIVGSGPNSCVLHYDRYDRRLDDGDLVVMDIGAECGHYAADVTRTVPAGGKFRERQRRVYQIVFAAQEAAFRAIRPGLPHREVDRIARETVAAGLIGLGLIAERSEAGKYFPHGTSHGLGMDVHDAMPDPILRPGMVITVEPGIYIADEALGVRIEDDVVVTEDGCEVLSAGIPRSIEEIEEWMRIRSF